MVRILMAFVVVGALAASAFASAAQLGVNGGSIQAGSDFTLACANEPVKVTAWAVNTIVGDYDGLDWVTITFDPDDAARCAGNDLVGRLRLDPSVNGGVAYGGAYNASAQAAGPSNDPTITIDASITEYRMAFHLDNSTTQRYFVPASAIQGIELWVGGPADVD